MPKKEVEVEPISEERIINPKLRKEWETTSHGRGLLATLADGMNVRNKKLKEVERLVNEDLEGPDIEKVLKSNFLPVIREEDVKKINDGNFDTLRGLVDRFREKHLKELVKDRVAAEFLMDNILKGKSVKAMGIDMEDIGDIHDIMAGYIDYLVDQHSIPLNEVSKELSKIFKGYNPHEIVEAIIGKGYEEENPVLEEIHRRLDVLNATDDKMKEYIDKLKTYSVNEIPPWIYPIADLIFDSTYAHRGNSRSNIIDRKDNVSKFLKDAFRDSPEKAQYFGNLIFNEVDEIEKQDMKKEAENIAENPDQKEFILPEDDLPYVNRIATAIRQNASQKDILNILDDFTSHLGNTYQFSSVQVAPPSEGTSVTSTSKRGTTGDYIGPDGVPNIGTSEGLPPQLKNLIQQLGKKMQKQQMSDVDEIIGELITLIRRGKIKVDDVPVILQRISPHLRNQVEHRLAGIQVST
jgi:hypothetical protein